MTKKKTQRTYDRLIDVGLKDPFVRGIAGMVVVATAASFAISALGSGAKAVITLSLCLAFGVVLVILRTLMRYADTSFVKIICFASSGVIMFIFLVFLLLLIPAATICWPHPYAELFGLLNCASGVLEARPFTPVPFTGPAIAFNPDNNKYQVLVFYRLARQEDAERIVGALRSAGYRSDGAESSLGEVIAPSRQPDTTLVKTTAQARPIVDDVSKVIKVAIPIKAATVSLFPDDAPLQRGNFQVDLF
jgi:hypothetical protein